MRLNLRQFQRTASTLESGWIQTSSGQQVTNMGLRDMKSFRYGSAIQRTAPAPGYGRVEAPWGKGFRL